MFERFRNHHDRQGHPFDCGERFEAAARDRHDHGFGGFGRGHDGFGRDPGDFHRFGPRERMFDAGDVKLVVLKLIAEQPSYGYQLMKTMEQRLAGGYTPSAGVIYPTLTMLEEEGLASATLEGNKKVYAATTDGLAFLADNRERLDALFERLEQAGRHFARGRSPEIMKAFMDLRGAVIAKVKRGEPAPGIIDRIAEIIRAAAKAIDEL